MATVNEILKKKKSFKGKNNIKGRCTICGKEILSLSLCHKTRDGLAHDDCYYETLSKHIDKHPIITPDEVE